MNTNERNSGMAITSLVLGILALICFGPLTGLPAIILGHIARSRARSQPSQYAGAGMALAGLVTGYVGLLAPVILAALLLPALAQAKAKAQRINCVNNLKQVGTSFRLWAGDNGERYPFNVPAKDGGTQVFSAPGPDGFDPNGWRHLQVLSNELFTPKILVCPADPSKAAAMSFGNFGPGNVSYQVRSGTNIDETNPMEVLVRCPIHGNELMCDGSVVPGSRKR